MRTSSEPPLTPRCWVAETAVVGFIGLVVSTSLQGCSIQVAAGHCDGFAIQNGQVAGAVETDHMQIVCDEGYTYRGPYIKCGTLNRTCHKEKISLVEVRHVCTPVVGVCEVIARRLRIMQGFHGSRPAQEVVGEVCSKPYDAKDARCEQTARALEQEEPGMPIYGDDTFSNVPEAVPRQPSFLGNVTDAEALPEDRPPMVAQSAAHRQTESQQLAALGAAGVATGALACTLFVAIRGVFAQSNRGLRIHLNDLEGRRGQDRRAPWAE